MKGLNYANQQEKTRKNERWEERAVRWIGNTLLAGMMLMGLVALVLLVISAFL